MNNISNPLSNLILDYWYKVLMVVGFFVFLLAGLGLLSAFPIAPTVLISSGLFFLGLGEWINHPLQTEFVEANAYHPSGQLTGYPRNNTPVGVLFALLGFSLIIYGLLRLFIFI